MNKETKTSRAGNRKNGDLRRVVIETGVNIHAEGSALISIGNTRVICTASVEEKVPSFLKGTGSGWVTAEYSMLPRATTTRSQREASKGKQSGRTMEIQRLVGRALRSVVIAEELGERTVWVDCDTLQADGGTRTASITGGAVSVGVVDGKPMVDLDYLEDSCAHTDMNVVMTGQGKFVEIQGTAEKQPFDRKEMDKMFALAAIGIKNLVAAQKRALPKSISKLIG